MRFAPKGRQCVANGLDAMCRGPETRRDPIGPVIKGNSDEHPRKNCGDDPERDRCVSSARWICARGRGEILVPTATIGSERHDRQQPQADPRCAAVFQSTFVPENAGSARPEAIFRPVEHRLCAGASVFEMELSGRKELASSRRLGAFASRGKFPRRYKVGLILLLVVLVLLFGGGGFYLGPPYHYFGGGLGTILVIVIIVLLLRG
jgi:hypothetical protein